ncbi:MAG: UbiX family flavin prenyltransferase [Candidatus Schekmanbacteria bacterium]|nr:UbiX family flavin prenyltransferase [Candidatus Schekmanbacteria bacterium]
MNYIVAISGASGAIYAQRLLQALAQEGARIQLIISDTARLVIKHELGIELAADPTAQKAIIAEQILGKSDYPHLHIHAIDNLAASIASGTAPIDAMIVLPCSMGTLSRIAHGISGNLIERSADVALKEKRPLILAPRETPLNTIHLRNMLELSQAGAQIIPCMPAFYHCPKQINDLIDFVVGKILDALKIDHQLFKRWE